MVNTISRDTSPEKILPFSLINRKNENQNANVDSVDSNLLTKSQLASLKNEPSVPNENIGALLVEIQKNIEQRQDARMKEQIAEVERMQERIDLVTTFLEDLDTQLTHSSKTIDLSNRQENLEKLREWFPETELLKKHTWTRDEAEALSKSFGRKIEHISRLINPKMVEVNRSMEDRHQILNTGRDILKMIREMHQGMISRQIPR